MVWGLCYKLLMLSPAKCTQLDPICYSSVLSSVKVLSEGPVTLFVVSHWNFWEHVPAVLIQSLPSITKWYLTCYSFLKHYLWNLSWMGCSKVAWKTRFLLLLLYVFLRSVCTYFIPFKTLALFVQMSEGTFDSCSQYWFLEGQSG